MFPNHGLPVTIGRERRVTLRSAAALAGLLAATAAPAEPLFLRVFGDERRLWDSRLAVAADGGFLVASRTDAPGSSMTLSLLRTGPDGRPLWHRSIDGPRAPVVVAALPAAEGHHLVVNASTPAGRQVWVAHVDDDGLLRWQVQFDGAATEAYAATADAAGLWIAGRYTADGAAVPLPVVLRVATDGSLLRQRTYAVGGRGSLHGIALDGSGGVIAIGQADVGASLDDVLILRIGADGDVVQAATMGGPNTDGAARGAGRMGLLPMPDGGIILACASGGEGWVVRLDAALQPLWQQRVPGQWQADAILPLASGSYLVALSLPGFGDELMELDGAGNLLGVAYRHGFDDLIRHGTDDLVGVSPAGGSNRMVGLHRMGPDGAPSAGCLTAMPPTLVTVPTTATTAAPAVTVGDPGLLPTAVASDVLPLGVSWWSECGDGAGCSGTLLRPVQGTVATLACAHGTAVRTTDPTPALTWEPVAGAVAYDWKVWQGEDCAGTTLASGTSPPDRPWTVSVPPLSDGVHSWAVIARGDGIADCDSPLDCRCAFEVDSSGPCVDDAFEEDDACTSARPVTPGAAGVVHRLCDDDWVSFPARAGEVFEVRTTDLSLSADTVLEVALPGCAPWLVDDDGGGGRASRILFAAPTDGTYSVRLGSPPGRDPAGTTARLAIDRVAPQPPGTWARTYGAVAGVRAEAVAATSTGGAFVSGTIGQDLWVARLDDAGIPSWSRRLDADRSAHGHALAELADGGVVVAGSVGCICPGSHDVWVLRFSPDGDLLWERLVGGPSLDEGLSVIVAPGGDILVAGHRDDGVATGMDAIVVVFDADGDHLETWEFESPHDDRLAVIRSLADGGFLVGGETRLSASEWFPRPWIARLEGSGLVRWQRAYDAAHGRATDAVEDAGGDLHVQLESGVLRLSGNGASLGFQALPGMRLRLRDDGSLVTAGTAATRAVDVSLASLGLDGPVHWRRALGGSGTERPVGLSLADDAIWLAANGDSFHGRGAPLLMRLAPDSRLAAPCPLALALEPPPALAAPAGAETALRFYWEAGRNRAMFPLVADAPMPTSLVCPDHAARPREVSPPGAAAPLLLAGRSYLSWEDASLSGSESFHLYRGQCADLAAGRHGDCLQARVPTPRTHDPATPAAGECWFYLVTGVNGAGEGPMGQDSAARVRAPASACP